MTNPETVVPSQWIKCSERMPEQRLVVALPSRPFHKHMQKARREIRKEFPKPKRKKRAT